MIAGARVLVEAVWGQDFSILRASRPDNGVLDRVVCKHLQTFIWELERHDFGSRSVLTAL